MFYNRFILFFIFLLAFFSENCYSQTLSQLKPVHCGQQMTFWLGQQGEVYSTYVSGATHYKYKATNITGNSNYFSEKIRPAIVNSTTSGSQINIGQFLGMKDTTWYSISVSWSSDNGVTWSSYGPNCQIKTGLSQPTQLQSAFCGIQTLSLTSSIACFGRPFAQQYRFRLKNIQGETFYDQTVLRSVNTFNWNNFSNVPAGKTFECYVQWNNGGDWKPWGPMCFITSPQLPLNLPNMPDRFVVGSSGMSIKYISTISAEQNQISYTVGEPFTLTYENSSSARIINQGFQQPDKVVISLTQPGVPVSGLMPSFNFTAYPNPFDSKISILAPPDYNKAVTVKIINDVGQLITDRLMNLNFLEIDLIDYSNGKYFVVITDESGEIIDTFPVVKYN
jgi:hypothetical protein